METNGIFRGTIPLLDKALDLRTMRHSLIASNIANKDTPHYKAFDLMVEKEMEKTVNPARTVQIRQTQPGHLTGGGGSGPIKSLSPTRAGYLEAVEGNTVDLDTAMGNLAENSVKYSATIQVLSKKFQGLKNVIQGGGR